MKYRRRYASELSSVKDFAEMSERVAVHESGHTCVNNLFGRKIESVQITDGGRCSLVPGCEGELEKIVANKDALLEREFHFQRIIALLAGAAAENKWRGRKSTVNQNGAQSDYETARAVCLHLNHGDEAGAELLLQWLERRAERLVEARWKQVHKLSFSLLEHEKLTGEEVANILGNEKAA